MIAEASVIAAMTVVADEVVDLSFKITRQEVVLQQDAVLVRLVPTLDLTPGHRVIRRRASNMIHAALREPVGQIAGDIT